MKPATLMLSAALASMMLFAPAAITSADAANIKIKPQIVKVKPKVKIAKPKVRIKIRAAKIRIKPKVKILAAKVRIKPKVKIRVANVPVKSRIKIRPVSANVAKAHVKPRLKPQSANLVKTIRLGSQTISVVPRNKPSRTPKITANNAPGLGKASIFSTPTKSPNTPDFSVSDGLVDVLSVSGGNMNEAMRNAADLDALRGVMAMQDLINSSIGTGELPTGSEGFGRQRRGAGFDGPPMGAAGAPSDGGLASSDGMKHAWTGTTRRISTNQRVFGPMNATASTVSRVNTQGERETFTEYRPDSGDSTIVQTTGSGDSTKTVVIRGIDAEAEGEPHELTVTTTEDGKTKTETVVVTTRSVPTEIDTDGDGIPDGTVVEPQAEQPAPHDNATGRGDGGCGVWTPLGGCTGTGPKIWETTGQPGPDEQGTVMGTGSARPNAGPGAVTNGGDGGFVAGGNTGGSGGFRHDPCATIKGAGCGGSGPGGPGPEGTVADAGTASSH